MSAPAVVWLNGPFGVGKNTVARELRVRAPGAVVLEPEWLGAMLRTLLPAPSGDFQDLAAWRALAARAAVAVADEAAGPVVVPMSVLRQAYAREILGAVRAAGVRVLHAVLHAEPDVLARRIAADAEDPGARGWRERHAAAYRDARWLRGADLWLDTSALTPAQAAERVLDALAARRREPAEAPWVVAAVDDVEGVPWQCGMTWHAVRMHLGLHAFGAGGFTARAAGELVVEPHVEQGEGRAHEELYVVTAGRARFTLDGRTVEVGSGRFVFVRPHVHREAVALEPGTAVLALGGPPAFEPAGHEWMARSRHAVRRGELARARELLEAGHREVPESPGIAFGWALLLAAEGRGADAAEQLERALAAEPRLRPEAEGEPLLEGLREPG